MAYSGAQTGLVGRDHELTVLDSFVRLSEADGSTLLLTGEPGVGKSVLLAAAAEMAAATGTSVVRAGGVEYESDLSFAGLHQLVSALGEDLRALPPGTRTTLEVALGIGSGPAPERLAVMHATLELCRQTAARSPTLLVVDDMHWLDRASSSVIGFVGRRLGGSRIGVLGAIRPSAGGYFERAGLPELEIGPLADPDAMTLLAHQFAHLPTRVLREVADEAQGNPLALLEFAAAAGRGQGTRHPAPTGLGREVRALFAARVGRLPDETRRLLLMAALEGSGSLAVLALASDAEGMAVLAPAERDHLVVVDDKVAEVRFRHPMVKSVLVEQSTHEERRVAHLRLSELLADQPERRGHHLAEAADAPDETTAAAVEAGAHLTLQRGDVVGAVTRLLRAADLSPGGADRSRRLADAAYVGALSAGQLERAARLLLDARRRDPTLVETLHAAVATAYLLLNSDGKAETTYDLLRVALESALAEPDQDRDGLTDALVTLVLLCHYSGRSEYWILFHQALARLSPAAPTDVLLLAETFADPLTASPWALAELDAAVGRLQNTLDVDVIIRTAIGAFYTDRLPACRPALERVVHDGRDGGAVGAAMRALLVIAFDDLNRGSWDAAEQAAAEATALCEETGYRLYEWTGRYGLALLAANRGDGQVCASICTAMVDWAAPRQLRRLDDWAHHALAQAALGASDFETGFAHATAISGPGTLASHNPQALWSALDLLDAALHTGRADAARAHADVIRRADLGRISPRYALITHAAAAMVAPAQEAPGLFDEALALPGIESWPFEVARIRLAHGERLRRLRYIREARTQLARARDGFDLLGARPWSRRAATELQATGATRQSGGPADASLTPQELEVAQLAASGLTNRQIAARLYVSPRTVATHLYRAFPKLGVASRAALRDALNTPTSDTHR